MTKYNKKAKINIKTVQTLKRMNKNNSANIKIFENTLRKGESA